MKKCNDCNTIKDYTQFVKNCATNDGYHTLCKECITIKRIKKKYNHIILKISKSPKKNIEILKELYSDKKKNIKLISIIFDCSEKIIIDTLKEINIYGKRKCKGNCKIWKELDQFHNCKKDIIHGKQFYCKHCYKKYKKKRSKNETTLKMDRDAGREYYSNNKNEINLRKRNRRKNNPDLVLHEKISVGVRQTLILGKKSKGGKSFEEFVNFSEQEAIEYLLPMIPNNKKIQDFDLDHIKPKTAFDLSNEKEFRKCWSLNNLQMIPRKINIQKSDKYDGTPENVSFNLEYVTLVELQENLDRF